MIKERDTFEEYICNKASLLQLPITGNFELLPLCNMNCKMCYIRMSKEEVSKTGQILHYTKWIRMAEEAKHMGTLFLLLTGGEPLLYPDFDILYKALHKMGFVITINTNGTLLNDKYLELFSQNPPRRINVTLYGASNETYSKICGYDEGFSKTKTALTRLKDKKVPVKINFTVTPDNVNELETVYEIASELDLPVETAFYMFPPNRNKKNKEHFERLNPQESAYVRFLSNLHELSEEECIRKFQSLLAYENSNSIIQDTAFNCRAGNSSYWINWKGEMTPCGMVNTPSVSPIKFDLQTCWNHLLKEIEKTKYPLKCQKCTMSVVCSRCAAASIAECGLYESSPEYLCLQAQAYLDYIKSYLQDKRCLES